MLRCAEVWSPTVDFYSIKPRTLQAAAAEAVETVNTLLDYTSRPEAKCTKANEVWICTIWWGMK